jgi:predicted metal-dependent hydrolase
MADYVFVSSTGEEIPIIITTRRGARNIILRPKTTPVHELHATKPWITPTSSVIKFIESKRKWIENIFARAPQKRKIAPGDEIEILGRVVVLARDTARRANHLIVHDDMHATLVVGGVAEMFESRVRNFVKTEFLKTAREMIKTATRELWPTRVVAHDTTSRWGSCSSTGTMSLSWRLAFAPRDVMRYVVMHELAHRRHMDHSPAFWATVGELYGFGVERAKRWLNQHGAELHEYF